MSPMRWGYELFYLITMEPYRVYLRDPSLNYAYLIFGFSPDHSLQAWVALLILTFVLRLLPYVALVRKESE